MKFSIKLIALLVLAFALYPGESSAKPIRKFEKIASEPRKPPLIEQIRCTLFPEQVVAEMWAPRDKLETAQIFAKDDVKCKLKQHLANKNIINTLCIQQHKPLDDEAIALIASFSNLSFLELHCPVQNPLLLKIHLPKSLVHLQVDHAYPLGELPKLQRLDVEYCNLDANFLRDLTAPNLRELYFHRIHANNNGFQHIGKFQNLSSLLASECYVDSCSVQHFYTMTHTGVWINNSLEYISSFEQKAKYFFQKQNYTEAFEYYREFVFCKPTSQGYLQLSSCCEKLQNKPDAIAFATLANNIKNLQTQI